MKKRKPKKRQKKIKVKFTKTVPVRFEMGQIAPGDDWPIDKGNCND